MIKPVSFGSRNNPVAPFEIKTSKGTLKVSEIDSSNIKSVSDIDELSRFFLTGFVNHTDDPSYVSLKDDFDNAVEHIKLYYKYKFDCDDGNLTALEARNDNNELCAAVLAYTMNEAGLYDPKTCYVDSMVVADEYMKNKVGTVLMDKVLDCSKNVYADAFLCSENSAVAFEEKNGFKKMDYSDLDQRIVIDHINAHRGCAYPKYETFMYKKTNKEICDKPWYTRVLSYFE